MRDESLVAGGWRRSMSKRFDESDPHPAWRLRNLRRRVDRARNFPVNTCPASRHLHMMAQRLAAGKPYPMLEEEPEWCAGAMLSVLESLWKARTRLAQLEADTQKQQAADPKTGDPP